jgi:hypothetical protein|tara:strand:+ start:902 stop:1123 length:222 start_codon:yes stop_codon:yes gene_type:complete
MKKTGKAIVEDNPNLKRDLSSTAIINTNNDAYSQRLAQKSARSVGRDEINNLKNEVQELKNLIHKLIEVNNDK